ncbi:uncharacterized protein At4g06744 [Ziziphus jujuba]|uniref:Uncharacterized protein At4g06744 n=1 Tax=Ziziphus jujuba TaxID=326968 RepID=A0ABM3IVB5_ZIZJJ|nr:uncharacterized protein At4g06744 [Ziziphus jujuba]
MGSISISIFVFFCASILFLYLQNYNYVTAASVPVIRTNREASKVIIGGDHSYRSPSPKLTKGCSLPPPPPPSCNPISPRVLKATKAIKTFASKIECDPVGYTETWKGDDACKYKGFVCAEHPDDNLLAVAGVDFNGANFNGRDLTLEGFIDELEDITIFHANSNNFTGKIPSKIAQFRFLYELDLSNNRLIGDFPLEVLGAKNLTFLDLRFNNFSGKVPPGLFNLDVDVLFINNNNLEQPLPDNLGSTPALYLTFANNMFTGPIPKSIRGASETLIEVLFLNNRLSGCLPMEIGYLKKATLFDASNNQLTGPIPRSFACLAKIELLNFNNNKLFGAVPEDVCKLPNLEKLSLANNYFTQVGPACRNLIERKILDVTSNCILDLPYQKPKAECARFFSKPSLCINHQVLTYIPCRLPWVSKWKSDSRRPALTPAVSASPPVSYRAHSPDGL